MPEKYDEHSEPYKELLHDFLNFETTGFKPFGKGTIGGADHYKSRGDYWEQNVGSRDAFRSLAKRVASRACALIPNSTMEKHGYDGNSTQEGEKKESEKKKNENEEEEEKTKNTTGSTMGE